MRSLLLRVKLVGGLKNKLTLPKPKTTQRTCLSCKDVQDKSSLLRLVVDESGQIWPDLSAKLPGRGVYLCLKADCLQKMSDKRLGFLRRDFSPQLPQWDILQSRMFDSISLRVEQLMRMMARRSAIGRDAVMHRMWDRKSLLILFARDAGEAVMRQVEDAVEKRRDDEGKSSVSSEVVVSHLDAKALGFALGREKVSVVAFHGDNPLEKFQQLCVWQNSLGKVVASTNRETR